MRQVYAIETHKDWRRVQKVLEVLFPLGFVLDWEYRMKTWKDVRDNYYLSSLADYTHILINNDSDCHMVVQLYVHWHREQLDFCKVIDLDEFVNKFKEKTICLS